MAAPRYNSTPGETDLLRRLGISRERSTPVDDLLLDLQNLLNTRGRCVKWDPSLTELDASAVGYGLHDYSGTGMPVREAHRRLAQEMEQLIRRFEPRLRSVVVTPTEEGGPSDRTLQFRIDAIYVHDRSRESVTIESVLRPSDASFVVHRWRGR